MSAAEYYNDNPATGYPRAHQQPYGGAYAAPPPAPAQHSQSYLSPYPQQQQQSLAPYARPGSAHSDIGNYGAAAPPPYPPSSTSPRPDAYGAAPPRPHSADPYGYRDGEYDDRYYGSDDGEEKRRDRDGERGRGQGGGGVEGDADRGLGATLVGGGAGGFLAHKFGKGTLGTVLGSAVGAIAANALEDRMGKGKKHGKHGHGHHAGGHGQHHGGGGGLLGRVENFVSGGSSSGGGSHHGGGSYYGGSGDPLAYGGHSNHHHQHHGSYRY